MKKFLLYISIVAGVAFTPVDGISKKERKEAAKFLNETEEAVLNAVKGLSEAQLNFKPAADKWSVEDCMKHIAVTEITLWHMTDSIISQTANPEKRSDIKMTDDDVKKNIEDRTNKVKTYPSMEPRNTSFKNLEEAMNSFKENRSKLISYVKNTDADLRNHVATLPFASFDCYQMILFIGAHSQRHLRQMEEVKGDPNFPKE